MSEAITAFDPERLEEIIAERGQENERRGEELVPLGRHPRPQNVPGLLPVVDGTLLSALPTMTEASLRLGKTGSSGMCWAGERKGAARPECETSATASGLATSRPASLSSRGGRRQADANANDRLKPVLLQTEDVAHGIQPDRLADQKGRRRERARGVAVTARRPHVHRK